MERLRRTVVQLEEAKRFIPDGEVARLRLAVILLDNALEVILQAPWSEPKVGCDQLAAVDKPSTRILRCLPALSEHRLLQVPVSLQTHPKLRRRLQEPPKSQRRVSRDAALS
jgi:hypothetical protein